MFVLQKNFFLYLFLLLFYIVTQPVRMKKSPEELAQEYIKDNHIQHLFEHLGTALMYRRPNNPHEFLIEELIKLRESSKIGITVPYIFNSEDIRTMFRMFDMLETGTISRHQYREALVCLGVPYVDPPQDMEAINLFTFQELIKQAIAEHQRILLKIVPPPEDDDAVTASPALSASAEIGSREKASSPQASGDGAEKGEGGSTMLEIAPPTA
eukprot:Rmarinus@m.7493